MDMNQIMQQAQQFQQKLGEMQEDLSQKTISSTVGGGMVTKAKLAVFWSDEYRGAITKKISGCITPLRVL